MHLIDDAAYSNRWRNWHPLEKCLLSLGMLVIGWTAVPWPGGFFVCVAMGACALFGAKIPWRIYVKVMVGPVLFLLVGGLALFIGLDWSTTNGLRLHLDWSQLPNVVKISTRAFAALACFMFLALTTPLPELLQFMKHCGLPGAVQEIALLIYNMLFVFCEESKSMHLAQESRCGYSSLKNSWHSFSMLAGKLFERCLRRSRQLEHGLSSRGFQGELRVLWTPPPISRARLSLIVLLLFAATSLAIFLN